MILLLNPLLQALDSARRTATNSINQTDDVAVDDQGDHWIFQFTPQEEILCGGAKVSVSKDGFQSLKVVREQ